MQFPTSSAEAMNQFNQAAQFLTTVYNDAVKAATPCVSKFEASQTGLAASLNCLKTAFEAQSQVAKITLVGAGLIALSLLIITTSLLKSLCCPNKAAAFKNKVTHAFTANGVSKENIEMILGTPHLTPKGVEEFLKHAGCLIGNETLRNYFTPAVMTKTTLNETGEIRFPLSALKKAGANATTLADAIHQQYDPATHQAKKVKKTK